MRPTRILIIGLVVLIGVLAAGCGGAAVAAGGSFAGPVEGSAAFFALVSSGEEVMAYYCDGQPGAPVTLSGWFRGPVSGEEVELTNDNGDTLVGLLSADGFNGTLTPAGSAPLAVAAEPVSQPAGLYRTDTTIDGETAVGGWIVLSDGRQRGSVKVGNANTSSALDTNTSTASTGDGKTHTPRWTDPDTEPARWNDPDPDP